MNKLEYRHIDLKSLKEDTFGDTSILKMIIELFIEDIDEFSEILNQELQNKNWQTLFQATHKIKPNISMFGITALESVILEIESSFRNEQNLENIEDLVNLVVTTFNHVKIELQTELKLMPNE